MIDRARDLARDLLPWGGLAALIGIAAIGTITPDMKELLLKWGPGLLMFLVVAQHVPNAVRAMQRQADAMVAVARDLQELPRRDEMKFEDLRIGQELILRELSAVKQRLDHDGRHA